MPSSARYGTQPFGEQIAFFRDKVPVPTAAWTDIYTREHDIAFMVAGANKRALVETFQATLLRVQEQGLTLEDFRKDFDRIVKDFGWGYNGGRNWRTRVIYETNLRQSYHAGREAQMADPELRRRRPYGLYRHGGSDDPRPEHQAKDGMVVRLDDPWWDVWSPQNGWGCSCKKFMISEREVENLGLTVTERPPIGEMETRAVGVNGPSPRLVRVPKGIDPGFEYRPGTLRRKPPSPIAPRTPPVVAPLALGRIEPAAAFSRLPDDARPAPRRVGSGVVLPAGLSDSEYLRAFLAEFGLDSLDGEAMFRDVAGQVLPISAGLFMDGMGRSKVNKRGRGPNVRLIAQTIRDPDEIWETMTQADGVTPGKLRRRYIASWLLPGEEVPTLAVFQWGRDGWLGVTGMSADDIGYLERQGRRGTRIYRRE